LKDNSIGIWVKIQYLNENFKEKNQGLKPIPLGPWLWKEVKIKEEKGECELRRRHSD
jgi:hypothetical protein